MSIARTTMLDGARDEVRAAIGQAAKATGVDFAYLLAQAKSESGLDPKVKAATSSATGLYQFLDQSWLAIVKKHGAAQGFGWAADAIHTRAGGGFTVDPAYARAVMGLREQAGPAALMAASYAADNAAGLQATLGRQTNATDLYFAHFLGLHGAKKFLAAADAAPDATAASLFPREARANHGIFYDRHGGARSLNAVYELMGRKLAAAGSSEGIDPPGTLVTTPPAAMDLPQQVAAADGAASVEGSTSVTTALAAIDRNRLDLLKPTPAQARLAYLMLSMPMV